MGLLLDSLEGALWTREMIRHLGEKDKDGMPLAPEKLPALTRKVISVDPSLGDGETSDECGIVGVGHWLKTKSSMCWVIGLYVHPHSSGPEAGGARIPRDRGRLYPDRTQRRREGAAESEHRLG